MYAKETTDAIAALKQGAAPKTTPFPDHPHTAASPAGYDPKANPYPKHVVVERDKKGFPTKTVEVKNAREEARALQAKEPAGE